MYCIQCYLFAAFLWCLKFDFFLFAIGTYAIDATGLLYIISTLGLRELKSYLQPTECIS